MSKNRGVQYSREVWLARRNSRSMGQTLRARERYIHISAGLLPAERAEDGWTVKPVRVSPIRSTYHKPQVTNTNGVLTSEVLPV